MPDIDQLRIKLFCDGADFSSLLSWSADPRIKGFTTNPTLMRKAHVVDYQAFARQLVKVIPDRPLSFEVSADDPETMEEQALAISSYKYLGSLHRPCFAATRARGSSAQRHRAVHAGPG